MGIEDEALSLAMRKTWDCPLLADATGHPAVRYVRTRRPQSQPTPRR